MPDNFMGDFLINVMGATNPTLGQNGQGVCGVNMTFDHEYLGDLSIVLTSPSGQSVTLVGPIGLFGGTDFTTWNVSFVPCGDPANPDPGFSAQWNNNQGWGLFGNYTGSYYPNNGCLENFNSGPVNGTWTLTVTDGQAVDVGNFINYEIIFCDPDGIQCFSCAADAGDLNQNDVVACEGSANLDLNLPPNYPPPSVPPPTTDYTYTYVIGGAGGVIEAYDPGPNLMGFPPGSYTVCGLSYLTNQEDDLPAPDGSLTIIQLNTQLESSTPPLCGNISGNCVNVIINENPPDEEETVTVCAPDCYEFHNQNYCNTGTYVRNLFTPQGCPYQATLYLTVVPPIVVNRTETICQGECATTPGFEGYCSSGTYQEHFDTDAGCDSIVNLTLVVLFPIATINQPGQLTCTQNTVLLSGVGSSTGPGVTYLWTASNGGVLSGNINGLTATATAEGDYQLRVCRTSGGITCCDSASVTVTADQNVPDAPSAIVGPVSICQGQTATYTATSVIGATSYVWSVPPGVVITSGQNTQSIDVLWNSTAGGNVCVTANNQCGPSPATCIAVTISPAATPSQPAGASAVCGGAVEAYSIPAVTGATDYTWTVTGGTLVSGQGTTGVVVNWGNSSGSVCVNVTSSCGVSQDVCLPVTVTVPPVSPAPNGPLTTCPDGTVGYTVINVPGANTYNWQVTNGTINSGQGSNSVQVQWNAGVSSGVVCANAANSCGTSLDSCININLSIPVAGAITHTCTGTNQFYSVSFPISGGTAPYTISGGTITNGVFTSDSIQSGLPYSFVITDANNCVSAAISGSFNCSCSTSSGDMSLTQLEACEDQTVTATHLGGQNLDANDTGAFYLHSNAGSSLGTVFGQNTTGTFGFTTGMSYETTYYISFVVGNNVGGFPDPLDPCLSVAQGQPVIFHQYPMANAGVDSDTCGLTTQLAASTGIGSGSWATVSGPSGESISFTGQQNPNSGATATGFGVYFLSWTLDNAGCSNSDTVAVSFNSSPLIGNVSHTCDATNDNYTVTFTISGGTPGYQVTGAPSGTVTGNVFTSNPIPNGQTYSYVSTDMEGCASPPQNGSFSCNCATGAGTMDVTTLTACEGGSVTATHLGGQNLDGNDIGAYFLHTNAGNSLGTVFAFNNTGTFTLQTGMSYGTTYYVSFIVGNNVNGSPDPGDFCLAVSPGQPVIFYQNPMVNAGVDLDTCGTVLNLQAAQIPGGTGAWTVTSGNTANINIDQPASATSSVAAAQSGTFTLTWTVTLNGCVGNDQVNIQFNSSPTLSNLVRDCDAANENFTVTLTLAGGTMPYSVNGTSVTGNTFVSAPFSNGQSYLFNVTDANGCSAPDISGAFSCNCGTNAGTMGLTTLSACEGNTITVTANSDQTLDGNDIVSYVLHNGAGPALGQVFAQNTTGVFSLQNGMNLGQTYYVSLVAGNPSGAFPDPMDPCFSVATGQPVIWLDTPAPNAGPNDEICGETIFLGAASSAFAGAWIQLSGPGTSTFSNANNAISEVTVSSNGIYTYQWTETNGICSGSDVVQIEFNQQPVLSPIVETCNGTNTQYVVSFTVNGGQPPYQSQGIAGAFTGNTFTSLPVANNSNYGFVIIDANGCNTPTIAGAENCACTTDAGTMQVAPLVFCANTPATAVWNNDGNTDADDIIRFILHTNSGSSAGTVLATNNQPTFNFGGNLQTGTVYYISAIAGSNVGGTINLTDPCLSVSPGTPVQWKPMPTATLAGTTAICEGSSTQITFQGTGTFPLSIQYSDGTSNNSLNLASNAPLNLNLTPAATTTFSLLSVTDGSLPACVTNLNQTATITVSQQVNAGVANEPVELCADAGINIVLSNLITGADLGGIWTQTSTNP
ncbi:MAG: proprotein convertase P-domain-containing protein, partial [Saprospiraceae bacterium]|nr:proprotein convertase P-domain-containing protein [Saprospiraceae bacterium]